jgi:hypothetical protein
MWSSSIADTIARERARDLREAAAVRPLDGQNALPSPEVTIRLARPADAVALERLAELDSGRLPSGEVVLAEVDGELRAAVGVAGGAPIADPFQPTAALASLLAVRAQQLRATMGSAQAAPRRARLVPVPNR